jgi:hypothetical protein
MEGEFAERKGSTGLYSHMRRRMKSNHHVLAREAFLAMHRLPEPFLSPGLRPGSFTRQEQKLSSATATRYPTSCLALLAYMPSYVQKGVCHQVL